MEHCSVLCGSLDEWEWSLDTCAHMAESLCCSPETITTLLTDHSSIQNKQLKKNYIQMVICTYIILKHLFHSALSETPSC